VKRLVLWGPVVLLTGLIFYVSSLPDPGPLPSSVSDKSAHFWAYAVLGALWMRALAGGVPPGVTRGRFITAVIATALYGASDEFHQLFVPGRSAELADLAADAAGGLVGAAIVAAIARRGRGA
jgi:VanZ family protein